MLGSIRLQTLRNQSGLTLPPVVATCSVAHLAHAQLIHHEAPTVCRLAQVNQPGPRPQIQGTNPALRASLGRSLGLFKSQSSVVVSRQRPHCSYCRHLKLPLSSRKSSPQTPWNNSAPRRSALEWLLQDIVGAHRPGLPRDNAVRRNATAC